MKDYYSVNINCGGPRATIGNKFYEADEDSGGATKFVPSSDHWGFSSTGSLLDANDSSSTYIATNVSVLSMSGSELYTRARLSPLSLTYYGRCLANGNYTVTLHFAEIIFRDNRSYQSLGRRAFDIYVQGVNQFKNFDIKKEAGGIDKEVNITLKNMPVTNKTLEIRFQYAGKGTTVVPWRGVYGPLISAISMEAEFKPPTHGKKYALIAIGSVASALCLGLIIVGIAWKKGYFGDRISREKGGTLLDGTPIAVKQLSSRSNQGNREFVNEIGMIAGIRHPNVGKAVQLKQKGSLMDLVDPRLGSEFSKREAVRMIKISLLCTNQSPALRPTMSEVVNILEGRTKIKEANLNQVTLEDEFKFQELGGEIEEIQSDESDEISTLIKPKSSSSQDLYPDSQDLYPNSQISVLE
ncbi:hypothetical protein L1887_33343 [Cichorium endivia]|nr:hypothetical protein L1887_33343 [Cichorium endivia]